MSSFPIERLRPRISTLSGVAGDVSIEIPLEPFNLNGEDVTTSIRLDGVNLPTTHPADLVGRVFDFPVNPNDGYIDGSVYIEHAHHPVDVSSISFESNGDRVAALRVALKFVFSVEGLSDYVDTPAELVAPIQPT